MCVRVGYYKLIRLDTILFFHSCPQANFRWLLCSAFLAVSGAFAPAFAQTDSAPRCEAIGEQETLRVAICEPGISREEQIKGAIAICGEQAECLVWIWSDRADAPETPPSNSDQLTPEQVRSANGVWINSAKQMVTISKD